MARYINQPDTTPPHECNPPVQKFSQPYWRTSTEVRYAGKAAVGGTVWQCDCGKIWRFVINDSNSGSWRLLEGPDRWRVHPRKTWKWVKRARWAFWAAIASLFLSFITLIFFPPIVAGFFFVFILWFGFWGGVALIIDQRVWDFEVQDEPIGDVIKK